MLKCNLVANNGLAATALPQESKSAEERTTHSLKSTQNAQFRTIHIETLKDKDSYSDWADSILRAFRLTKLLPFAETPLEDHKPAADAAADVKDAWELNKEKALQILISTTDPDARRHIHAAGYVRSSADPYKYWEKAKGTSSIEKNGLNLLESCLNLCQLAHRTAAIRTSHKEARSTYPSDDQMEPSLASNFETQYSHQTVPLT